MEVSSGESVRGVCAKSQQPCVRRLMREVSNLPLVKSYESCDLIRFTKIALSLAIPISTLMEKYWEKKNHRKIQKILSSFREGIEYLVQVEKMDFGVGSGIHANCDRDLDLIKYESARLFQLAVKDVDEETGHVPLPASSSIAFLSRKQVFVGQIWKMIREWLGRARSGEKRAISFFASYLLSKRGWPELCQNKRFETIADHQKYLSREPSDVSSQLLETVRATSKTVFRHCSLKKLNPSRNASYESSRKEGGARGWVHQLGNIPQEVQPMKTFGESLPLSVKDIDLQARRVRQQEWETVKLFRPRMVSSNIARVQVIPEPGKFRVITAGPAIQYTYLQPLQGSLLENWSKTPYSTMKENWEDEVKGWVIPDGWVWNSGDYKAATDQLNSNTSNEVMETIKEIYNLGEDFVSGFEGCEIEYSAKDVKRNPFGAERLPRSIWQKNGQLMGHPLSFPILCVINLAALIASLNRGVEEGKLSREDKSLILSMTKINGDDILFPCPKWFCAMWEKTTSEVGLELSVGKSYASESFAMVNNTMFKMVSASEYELGARNERLGYLNQKLILNYSLKSGESSQSPLEIGKAVQEMMKYCPAARSFMYDVRRNRTNFPIALQSQTGQKMIRLPNLFIDSKLGGLGIDPAFCKGKLRASPDDRRIATLLGEGVINSFFYSNKTVKVSSAFEKVLQRLPKPILSSSAKASQLEMTTVLHGFSTKHGSVRGFDPEGEGYKQWIGMISEAFQSNENSERRIIRNKAWKKVHKMKGLKVFYQRPFYLFPALPKMAGKVELHYPEA